MQNKIINFLFFNVLVLCISMLCGCERRQEDILLPVQASDFEVTDLGFSEFNDEVESGISAPKSAENIAAKSDEENALSQNLATEINEETDIFVHVCGAVKNPGVYELIGGSRVYEAVDMAGGFLDEADVSFINLAAVLTDGQKIYVYTLEETSSLEVSDYIEDIQNQTAVGETTSGNKININTATEAELEQLNGIGKTRAQAIIEYRNNNGRFESIESIKKVSGIGDSTYEKLKEQICV